MKLSPRQLQYLYYIDLCDGSNRLITDLSERMEVTKGAVSQVLNQYERKGLIQREAGGSVTLTQKAREALTELKEKSLIICSFFQSMPNLTDEQAARSALEYCVCMPWESVEGLAQSLKGKEKLRCVRWDMLDKTPDMTFPFPDGVYEIPFDVYKAHSFELSMGDKGFVKPARMDVKDGKGVITLKAKVIRHQGGTNARFRGKLSSLSCFYDGEFVRIRSEDDEYVIPLYYAMKLSPMPDDTLCATFRIKAETSCVYDMHIHESDIIFRFV